MFDKSLPAYCGYCKTQVLAEPVELVIDNEPEIRHYECPHCKGKIGDSRLGDAVNVLMFIMVVAVAWALISIWMNPKL